MRDVAKLAGFSVSTVSHVINETRFVEEDTKQKILHAIKTLNYRPNILAQSLKGKGTQTLGVIIGDIRLNFFSEIVKSIDFTSNKAGYNVILCDAEESIEEELFYIDVLLRKGIDGLILAPVDLDLVSSDLLDSKIPFVQIDRKSNQYESDFIGIDNVKSAETATLYLIDQDYHRLGFVSFEERYYPSKLRTEGFKKAISARGLTDQGITKTLNYHAGNKLELIKAWLLEHKDIEAVFCENDDLCYATIGAIEDIGLNIPQDIGIVTFDDSRWFQYLKTPITAIRQPTEAIGRLAVEVLLKRIQNPSHAGEYQNILLSTEFVVRASCGEQLRPLES
jgi:DNA-binding LacI/PurR family transcriptional regulator